MGHTKTASKTSSPDRLDRVVATMLDELREIGVFYYNKLLCLFEYFFIRNLAERYTGEEYI
jgi:hypothetical protein